MNSENTIDQEFFVENNVILTTLNINSDILKKIHLAADFKNISPNEIISFLLKKTLKNHNNRAKLYYPVKYQKKDPGKRWKIYHVRFNAVDYEVFTDQRKFFKMSVSLLLAYAVKKYLDDLYREEDVTYKDNYYANKYKIVPNNQTEFLIWQTYWHKSLINHRKE